QGALTDKDAQIEEKDAKIKELEPPAPSAADFGLEQRIVCPMCQGHEIKSVEDKTRVLSYVGHVPLYAKKNVCKRCGYEF
ncbi:MAG TPA: hypothetical protein VKK79_13380, partial [Candidatus Lokiarchaeia archaeon]|nr:hypothetical protein [Candidatus Lokiarchaeia archaeon]